MSKLGGSTAAAQRVSNTNGKPGASWSLGGAGTAGSGNGSGSNAPATTSSSVPSTSGTTAAAVAAAAAAASKPSKAGSSGKASKASSDTASSGKGAASKVKSTTKTSTTTRKKKKATSSTKAGKAGANAVSKAAKALSPKRETITALRLDPGVAVGIAAALTRQRDAVGVAAATPNHVFTKEVHAIMTTALPGVQCSVAVIHEVESAVRRCLVSLLRQAYYAAQSRSRKIVPEDVLLLLQHDPLKVQRLIEYLAWRGLRRSFRPTSDRPSSEFDSADAYNLLTFHQSLSVHVQRRRYTLPWSVAPVHLAEFSDDEEEFLVMSGNASGIGVDDLCLPGYAEILRDREALDRVTRAMTLPEYIQWTELRTHGFTYGQQQVFRNWIDPRGAMIDLKTQEDSLELFSLLAVDCVRLIAYHSLVVRRELASVMQSRRSVEGLFGAPYTAASSLDVGNVHEALRRLSPLADALVRSTVTLSQCIDLAAGLPAQHTHADAEGEAGASFVEEEVIEEDGVPGGFSVTTATQDDAADGDAQVAPMDVTTAADGAAASADTSALNPLAGDSVVIKEEPGTQDHADAQPHVGVDTTDGTTPLAAAASSSSPTSAAALSSSPAALSSSAAVEPLDPLLLQQELLWM